MEILLIKDFVHVFIEPSEPSEPLKKTLYPCDKGVNRGVVSIEPMNVLVFLKPGHLFFGIYPGVLFHSFYGKVERPFAFEYIYHFFVTYCIEGVG